MARPDAALALAALYVSASRRDSRMGAVCVTGAGLDTAIFCDIVSRFYSGGQGRAPSSNTALPVGLPHVIADAVRSADGGSGRPAQAAPTAVRSTPAASSRFTDTALADAVLRNGVTFSAEAVVVLSAAATWFARSIVLAGNVAQYKQRVKRFVIVEAGGAGGMRPRSVRSFVRCPCRYR